MRAFRWFTCILVLIILVGCGTQSDKRSRPPLEESAPAAVAILESAEGVARDEAKAPQKVPLSNQPRKVIKKGSLEFETTDIGSTRKTIDSTVAEHGGYIAEDREYRTGDRIVQNLVIRVPADKFDELVKKIVSAAGTVEGRSVSVRDVTEEFIDIQARLKTKKDLENRYRELLGKAETVKDMVSIEREMGKLREEIESVEGRLKYLSDQVSFSTLKVTYYQKISTISGLTLSRLKSSFVAGWNNLVSFVLEMLSIWPFIIVVILGFFGIRRYRRKRKQAKAAAD